ncbi:unnamed protein product [Lactuca saligna]|uniref:Transmembrane protein n=1 Tax=Lactuca saligna TaxID=75948 RepID=A0AA35V9L0_LACSI|nr:unnamed protein product [Lactuca saligna]
MLTTSIAFRPMLALGVPLPVPFALYASHTLELRSCLLLSLFFHVSFTVLTASFAQSRILPSTAFYFFHLPPSFESTSTDQVPPSSFQIHLFFPTEDVGESFSVHGGTTTTLNSRLQFAFPTALRRNKPPTLASARAFTKEHHHKPKLKTSRRSIIQRRRQMPSCWVSLKFGNSLIMFSSRFNLHILFVRLMILCFFFFFANFLLIESFMFALINLYMAPTDIRTEEWFEANSKGQFFFFVKVGYQGLESESKLLCVLFMDMATLSPFSLKVSKEQA